MTLIADCLLNQSFSEVKYGKIDSYDTLMSLVKLKVIYLWIFV